jgi:hypothetical protein
MADDNHQLSDSCPFLFSICYLGRIFLLVRDMRPFLWGGPCWQLDVLRLDRAVRGYAGRGQVL